MEEEPIATGTTITIRDVTPYSRIVMRIMECQPVLARILFFPAILLEAAVIRLVNQLIPTERISIETLASDAFDEAEPY